MRQSDIERIIRYEPIHDTKFTLIFGQINASQFYSINTHQPKFFVLGKSTKCKLVKYKTFNKLLFDYLLMISKNMPSINQFKSIC